MKTCTKCGIDKSLSEFGKNSNVKSGLQSRCKDCFNAYSRQRRITNRDKVLAVERRYKAKVRGTKEQQERARRWNRKLYYADVEQSRAYYRNLRAKSKEAVKLANAKQRAKRRAVEHFEVSTKELKRIYNSPCAFCGSTEDITLDHIVPLSRGGRHSIGNLQPLCFTCNHRKHARFMMEWKLEKSTALVR